MPVSTGKTEEIVPASSPKPKNHRHQARIAVVFFVLVLLILVYPANIDMFINDVGFATDEFGNTMRVENMSGVFVRNLIRLPFQFVFAWLIWRHTRKTSSIHRER